MVLLNDSLSSSVRFERLLISTGNDVNWLSDTETSNVNVYLFVFLSPDRKVRFKNFPISCGSDFKQFLSTVNSEYCNIISGDILNLITLCGISSSGTFFKNFPFRLHTFKSMEKAGC